jgi:phage shock protein PspC (stress-responsive transcriptional regulator)
MNDRLYRTSQDRMLLGVMGGISLRLGMDPSIIRIIYAIVTVVSGIFPLAIAYVVMAFVIPEAPPGWEASMRAAGPGGPGGSGPGGSGSAGADPTGWGADRGAGAAGDAAGSGGPTGWATAAGPTGAAGTSGHVSGPAWGATWEADVPGDAGTAGRRRDPRVGAIVGGLVLVGLGSLFLLVQVVPDLDWGVVGPTALVVLGVILILGSIRRA